ncbi:hypothetical protein FRC08_014420 [Ceratobasidium sp. 394]|nr:hypothetical protein FRC08_014420 [Ceratobasidium sp. 394]
MGLKVSEPERRGRVGSDVSDYSRPAPLRSHASTAMSDDNPRAAKRRPTGIGYICAEHTARARSWLIRPMGTSKPNCWLGECRVSQYDRILHLRPVGVPWAQPMVIPRAVPRSMLAFRQMRQRELVFSYSEALAYVTSNTLSGTQIPAMSIA